MIEVSHLTKKYGKHVAVDDLSFQLEEGKIYGFLGPNGAGKSTTLNMMTGYLASTSGEVKINGYDILKEAEQAKRNIGYLPEIPPVYDNMTVLEYLVFVAELKGIQKTEQAGQIRNVMELTRISDMQDRLIQNLSKGYRQRVGIAQAVLGYPAIIILDEPTVGLDPKQIIEIRELIKELGKKHTVILSSHILTEISAVCDYVLILSHGKLVASDTLDNLQGILNGNGRLELTVRGDEKAVKSVIGTLKKTEKSEVRQQEQDCEVILETAAGTDIRQEVFFAFAKAQLPIIRMELRHMTLEDVFLELTGEKEGK
ncbi:MAG: ABC transporter ATP-binding protein [Lachnospiraceae bacterium]|nr:ABC transporter ATP-binding protein [Lachnospiraceae bacterium]